MSAHGSKRPPVPAIIALLLVLAAVGWWAWTSYWQGADEREGMSGTVEAEEYQVASVIAGRIESSLATEGAETDAGQVLFLLDDDILSLQIDQAKAGVRAARAALRQAKDDDESRAEIAAAQARVDQAAAALRMARVQLGYTKVSAPVSGTITAVAAKPGETISPGRALATVSDLSRLTVNVYVAETEVGKVEIGQSARVLSDAGGTWSGRVDFIADQAEFTPNNIETKEQRVKLVYQVRIAIDARQRGISQLRPGMPVTVVLENAD